MWWRKLLQTLATIGIVVCGAVWVFAPTAAIVRIPVPAACWWAPVSLLVVVLIPALAWKIQMELPWRIIVASKRRRKVLLVFLLEIVFVELMVTAARSRNILPWEFFAAGVWMLLFAVGALLVRSGGVATLTPFRRWPKPMTWAGTVAVPGANPHLLDDTARNLEALELRVARTQPDALELRESFLRSLFGDDDACFVSAASIVVHSSGEGAELQWEASYPGLFAMGAATVLAILTMTIWRHDWINMVVMLFVFGGAYAVLFVTAIRRFRRLVRRAAGLEVRPQRKMASR
jgi:hypothetical protein